MVCLEFFWCKISKLCCSIHSSALFIFLQKLHFLHVRSIDMKTTFIFCLIFITFVVFIYEVMKQSDVNVMGAASYPFFPRLFIFHCRTA